MRWLAKYFAGRRGYVALGAMLLSYFVLEWVPFHWDPPRRVVSGAHWSDDGSLLFSSEGLVNGHALPPWAYAAVRLETLAIDVRVRALGESTGPIFSYSDWAGDRRNVMLGQHGRDLVAALRRPGKELNGPFLYVVPDLFATPAWHDIEFRVEAGAARVTVDGREAVSERLPAEPFSGWELGSDFVVMLGNELNGKRPWLGEIARCHVVAGTTAANYLAGSAVAIPEVYWVNLKFNYRLALQPSWDNLCNFLFFVPLGFVVASLRGERGSFLLAILFCTSISAVGEVGQFGFDRMPSRTDWLMNTLGAIAGAGAARLSLRWAPEPLLAASFQAPPAAPSPTAAET